MNDFTIAIYCFIDDYLQIAGKKAAAKRKLNDVEILTTAGGVPVSYFIVAGSVHDGKALQAVHLDLPPQSSLYGGSAYTNYEREDLLPECGQVSLLTQRKRNSKRKESPAMEYIRSTMRKRIETTFSQVQAAFPRSIHAVTPEGFLLKIMLFHFPIPSINVFNRNLN